MPIDCHTHCFPQKIAASALFALRNNCGNLKCLTDGTADGLLNQMNQAGISSSWVLNIATTPRQQKAVNDFAASLSSDRLIAFGSVHPRAVDALSELERMADLGLRGLKLHPYYQGFAIDDPIMRPIYQKAAKLGFITVFHAGYDIGFLDTPCAAPRALARALTWFDGAPVVAAHLGGSFCWQEARRWLAGKPIYFDTAFCCGRIPFPEACSIIETHGVNRILFGSDLPWSDPVQELDFIRCLRLSESEQLQLLEENAKRLLQRL